jgi:hypothetical protein
VPRHPGGRPTTYKPEYCNQLIEHRRGGHSLESFASTIGVGRQSIYDWSKKHPEFSYAIKVAKEVHLKTMESLLLAVGSGKVKGNAAVLIFMMKNMHGWRDTVDVQTEPTSILTVVHSKGKEKYAI